MFGHGVGCAVWTTATDRTKVNMQMQPVVNACIESIERVQGTFVLLRSLLQELIKS